MTTSVPGGVLVLVISRHSIAYSVRWFLNTFEYITVDQTVVF